MLYILERGLCAVSAMSVFVLMMIVVISVFMRYFLDSPLNWTHSIISSYLIVAVFYLAIADGLRINTHIAIDVFQPYLPKSVINGGMVVGYIMAAILMGLILWKYLERFLASWTNNEIISMTVPWPTWVTYLLVCLGCFFMMLRCLMRVVAYTKALINGDSLAVTPSQ